MTATPDRHRDLPGVLLAQLRADRPPGTRRRRAVRRAPQPRGCLVHPRVLGRGGGPVQPVGRRRTPTSRAFAPEQLPVRPEPARGRRGAPVVAWSSAPACWARPGSSASTIPARTSRPGRTLPTWYDRAVVRGRARRPGHRSRVRRVRHRPARRRGSDDDELEAALADLAGERLTRPTAARTADLARRIAACSYEVEFPPETAARRTGAVAAEPVRVARDRGRPLRACRGRRRLPGDLHRVRRCLDRPAADRDRRLPALPDVPAGRAGRAEQGHGPVPAPGRRPLRRPLPLGPGEQRHRHLRRRGLVGRRRARCRRRAVRGSCSSSGTAVRRSRPRPAGSC